MSALYLLVGFSLLVALIFLGAFFWALRNGQYTDTTTPALRMLFEERGVKRQESSKEVSN
ncbi:MAG: cbb3-type cytochrome oxidase maturation protein [Candidatus Latescibacterota bacterium]|jgi:cbb3-type cytochrome oxidase maturation protein